jgi:hypothetical protein
MSDTQVLLRKIAALRQRLEQAPPVTGEGKRDPDRLRVLECQAAAGSRHQALVDGSLRQLKPVPSLEGDPSPLPSQLTARARRLLQRGQDLLSRLRSLSDEPYLASAFGRVLGHGVGSRIEPCEESDPLAARFRETVAMTDVALRTIQAFPDTATAQIRLCEGLEGVLADVGDRVAGITAVVEHRRREAALVDRLADLLLAVSSGKTPSVADFMPLVELTVQEAPTASLRFLDGPASDVPRFVACHSLTVGRVMARVVRHDPDHRSRPADAVLAALLHDVGMLKVPAAILTHRGPLDDAQRRQVEGHARAGADLLRRLASGATWLIETAAGHHERLDGTGYPAGLRDRQIAPLTRLLAVCDVYAALCTPRSYRPARETRTALTDTLLLAERGGLDRYHAERLLHLGFYPVGSVVELADGSVGVVVATPTGGRDLNSPARPVVALLHDDQGRPVPVARHLDLAESEGPRIVRSLPDADRRELLGHRHPELW